MSKSSVSSVDRATSNVEVFEELSDRIAIGDGRVPYFLALWCLDHNRKQDAAPLLELAAFDPVYRSLAYFALANLEENVLTKKMWLSAS